MNNLLNHFWSIRFGEKQGVDYSGSPFKPTMPCIPKEYDLILEPTTAYTPKRDYAVEDFKQEE